MNAAPVHTAARSAFDRFIRHCARYRAISRTVYPHGVVKFRNVVEAQVARQRVARDAARI